MSVDQEEPLEGRVRQHTPMPSRDYSLRCNLIVCQMLLTVPEHRRTVLRHRLPPARENNERYKGRARDPHDPCDRIGQGCMTSPGGSCP